MFTPILSTKLYILPPRPNVVLRPRLSERLNEGLHRKLTLISAPAGFGKTTLLSDWLNQKDEGRRMKDESGDIIHPSSFILHPSKVAWLSLDAGDSDPNRFLAYLVAALRTIAPTLGASVVGALQSAQPALTEALLTALLNEIATIRDDFVLVLDDYHVIDATAVDAALAFLVEHLPPHMHLVIATREDPKLPLARLRARGQLTELRAADLRFTPAEAAAFLNQVMDLRLSATDIATLEDRTEGWIVGLQLAALSMQGHQDIPAFIRAFAGDHRYIVDYLVEEVLQRQPEPVRSFLLQTAILDRLNGSLCDAVLDDGRRTTDDRSGSVVRRPSSVVLEELERGNFFVVPLDDQRHWYRYHHLFAEVLAAHLRAEQPDRVAMLHQRASVWYEQHGLPADAIRHALAAQDFARAAGLVELAVPAMRQSRQEATLLGWLKALPDELIPFRPVLGAHYVGALLSVGEFTGVEDRLRDAERWLGTTGNMQERLGTRSAEMIVVDEAEFRRLPGLFAVYRAGFALARGDVAETVTYARRALDLVLEEDHLGRGAATALLGLAYWTSGDLAAAYQSFADGMAHIQVAGNIADAIGGTIALADIRIAQGRLREAMHIYERGLQLATEQGTPTLRGTADMYVGMSEIEREHNDLPAATAHLLSSKAQGEHTGFPQNRYRWCVAMARIREAQGDLDGALALLHEAERLYVSDFFPNVRPVAALKVRVWVAGGRLREALDWARDQGLSADDELSYLREFEHITLARLLLARSTSDRADSPILEAMKVLERLLKAAEEGKRARSVIEILVLQALAHQMHGDLPAALVALARALALAEPEGYIRMFVDEGPAMADLLSRMKDEGGRKKVYIHKLLVAFGTQGNSSFILYPQPLVEPLSQRELAVLRLLRTDLNGPDIARELTISLNTLRTHTKNIYAKLGVNDRRAAVHRATKLELL